MVKFDLNFKIHVLHRYFDGVGSSTLAKQFGIAEEGTILLWAHRFNQFGLNGLESRVIHPDYDREFKVSVLNWMKQNNSSYPETALHFDISAPSTVWQWARRLEQYGLEGLTSRRKRRTLMAKHKISKPSSTPASKDDDKELKRLKEENLLLKIENEYLKKLDALARQKSHQQR